MRARPRFRFRQHTLIGLLVLGWASDATAQATRAASDAQVSSAPASSANAGERARQAFERARQAYARGDLGAARDGLTKARELSPSPELAYDLARVHERMGDADAAAALYAEYLALGKPSEREREEIARALAKLARQQARNQEALEAPAPDAGLLGDEARAMFERGVMAFRAKRYEAALAAFLAAKSSVALPELDYNLALTCERLGRPRDALDHYRAYLANAGSALSAADAERIRQRIRTIEDAIAAARSSSGDNVIGPRPPPQGATRRLPKSAQPLR